MEESKYTAVDLTELCVKVADLEQVVYLYAAIVEKHKVKIDDMQIEIEELQESR